MTDVTRKDWGTALVFDSRDCARALATGDLFPGPLGHFTPRRQPKEGSGSPWGPVRTAFVLAAGVVSVATDGHGGIWLSSDRLAQMPADERSTDGWYEEDCEAAWPLRRFRADLNLKGFSNAKELDNYLEGMMSRYGGNFAKVAMRR